MKIKIIGSGCHSCETLHKMVLHLKEGGKIKANIEYSKDINELVELGAMGSPALVVNGKLVSTGMPKSEEDLLEIIKSAK